MPLHLVTGIPTDVLKIPRIRKRSPPMLMRGAPELRRNKRAEDSRLHPLYRSVVVHPLLHKEKARTFLHGRILTESSWTTHMRTGFPNVCMYGFRGCYAYAYHISTGMNFGCSIRISPNIEKGEDMAPPLYRFFHYTVCVMAYGRPLPKYRKSPYIPARVYMSLFFAYSGMSKYTYFYRPRVPVRENPEGYLRAGGSLCKIGR